MCQFEFIYASVSSRPFPGPDWFMSWLSVPAMIMLPVYLLAWICQFVSSCIWRWAMRCEVSRRPNPCIPGQTDLCLCIWANAGKYLKIFQLIPVKLGQLWMQPVCAGRVRNIEHSSFWQEKTLRRSDIWGKTASYPLTFCTHIPQQVRPDNARKFRPEIEKMQDILSNVESVQ